MAYNKGQATEAYPVAQQYPPAQQYQQPYGGQQQAYGYAQPVGGATVAQPYNGPTAQQAVVGQAGNQTGQHVVVVRQQGGAGGQQPPQDYCVCAWLSCLCCCCPIGLFAIFMSMSVKSKWRNGDFDGAYRASEMAKKASIAAVVVGIIWSVAVGVMEGGAIENGAAGGGQGSYNPDAST